MKDWLTWLNGKKTYVGVAMWGAVSMLETYGIIDSGVAKVAEIIILTFTGFSARAAVQKSGVQNAGSK